MSTGPTPEELREARRQSLLQAHVNGKRLTSREMDEIEDLISEQEVKPKKGRAKQETCKVEWLAKIMGITARRIQQLADDGTVPKSGRGEYPRDLALIALREHKESLLGNVTAEIQRNKARAQAAEADNTELETIKRRGEFRVYARAVFADGFAKLKTSIESAMYLSQEQRDKLFADIHAIVLTEPEPE